MILKLFTHILYSCKWLTHNPAWCGADRILLLKRGTEVFLVKNPSFTEAKSHKSGCSRPQHPIPPRWDTWESVRVTCQPTGCDTVNSDPQTVSLKSFFIVLFYHWLTFHWISSKWEFDYIFYIILKAFVQDVLHVLDGTSKQQNVDENLVFPGLTGVFVPKRATSLTRHHSAVLV